MLPQIPHLLICTSCRYGPGDPVEAWLHEVLCLDAAQSLPRPPPRLPHPSQCDLYYVQRDTLFSFHKVLLREAFGRVFDKRVVIGTDCSKINKVSHSRYLG